MIIKVNRNTEAVSHTAAHTPACAHQVGRRADQASRLCLKWCHYLGLVQSWVFAWLMRPEDQHFGTRLNSGAKTEDAAQHQASFSKRQKLASFTKTQWVKQISSKKAGKSQPDLCCQPRDRRAEAGHLPHVCPPGILNTTTAKLVKWLLGENQTQFHWLLYIDKLFHISDTNENERLTHHQRVDCYWQSLTYKSTI